MQCAVRNSRKSAHKNICGDEKSEKHGVLDPWYPRPASCSMCTERTRLTLPSDIAPRHQHSRLIVQMCCGRTYHRHSEAGLGWGLRCVGCRTTFLAGRCIGGGAMPSAFCCCRILPMRSPRLLPTWRPTSFAAR